MKYNLIAVMSALLILSTAYGQSDDAEEIKILLRSGTHTARSFLPKTPELNAKDTALQNKIARAMGPYLKNIALDSLTNPEYLERLLAKAGISQEELQAYAQKTDDQAGEIQMMGVDSFEIKRTGNIISFHSLGSRCRPLDSLSIDLDGNVAIYRGVRMGINRSVSDNSLAGPLKRASKLYEYSFRSAFDPNVGPMHVMDNLTHFQLDIGRYLDTGDLVLAFFALKNVDKMTVLNITTAFFYK